MWRDLIRNAPGKIRDGFIKNPAAWILFGLLVLAECGNYETGRDLRRVCDLAAPHIATVPDRYATTVEQKIDNICGRHEPED